MKTKKLAGGQFLVNERAIGDEAERGLGGFWRRRDVVVVHEDPSGRGFQYPGNHPDGRGLARTVGPEEAMDLSGSDFQADAIDCRERAVLLDQFLDPDHRAQRSSQSQQVGVDRWGTGRASGAVSDSLRPTITCDVPGVMVRSRTAISSLPIRGRILACSARLPRARRRCRVSAGNWLKVGSTGSQSPTPFPSSRYTSGHAW